MCPGGLDKICSEAYLVMHFTGFDKGRKQAKDGAKPARIPLNGWQFAVTVNDADGMMACDVGREPERTRPEAGSERRTGQAITRCPGLTVPGPVPVDPDWSHSKGHLRVPISRAEAEAGAI